jgi:hypothetical protein
LGAASSQVEEVTVTGPDGRRVLPFAQNGRAFLTVYPPSVARGSITISIRLKDGTTRDYAAPRRVGALGLNDPPLELIGALSIHQSATAPTTFVLTAALTRPAKRFEVTFLGREIRMKRTGGSARSARVTYAGVYDATKGKRRTVKVGKLYFVSIIRCAQGCLRSTQAVRVGKPRSP